MSHIHLSTPGRAILAAFIKDGSVALLPSGKLLACACGVSAGSVSRAVQLPAQERWAVLRGARPLVVQPRLFKFSVMPVEQQFDSTVNELGFEIALDRLALLEQVGAVPNGAAAR